MVLLLNVKALFYRYTTTTLTVTPNGSKHRHSPSELRKNRMHRSQLFGDEEWPDDDKSVSRYTSLAKEEFHLN